MTVTTKKRILVTIVSESLIEGRLIEALIGLGVKGYSVSACRGDSIGTIRASEWSGDNIQIQTLVNTELSDKILAMLQRDFLGKYALVAFRTEVDVLRAEKFE
jgi:hypothetical protein